jgi:hypothetical protein
MQGNTQNGKPIWEKWDSEVHILKRNLTFN